MNEINLSTFYRHSSFMKDVHEGEKKIMESEKELSRLPKEESLIQIGDLIFSSGKGTKIENIQGKVLDKSYIVEEQTDSYSKSRPSLKSNFNSKEEAEEWLENYLKEESFFLSQLKMILKILYLI